MRSAALWAPWGGQGEQGSWTPHLAAAPAARAAPPDSLLICEVDGSRPDRTGSAQADKETLRRCSEHQEANQEDAEGLTNWASGQRGSLGRCPISEDRRGRKKLAVWPWGTAGSKVLWAESWGISGKAQRQGTVQLNQTGRDGDGEEKVR